MNDIKDQRKYEREKIDYENDNGVITISQSERSVVIKNIKENLWDLFRKKKSIFGIKAMTIPPQSSPSDTCLP